MSVVFMVCNLRVIDLLVVYYLNPISYLLKKLSPPVFITSSMEPDFTALVSHLFTYLSKMMTKTVIIAMIDMNPLKILLESFTDLSITPGSTVMLDQKPIM